jgi:hypothetical protein
MVRLVKTRVKSGTPDEFSAVAVVAVLIAVLIAVVTGWQLRTSNEDRYRSAINAKFAADPFLQDLKRRTQGKFSAFGKGTPRTEPGDTWSIGPWSHTSTRTTYDRFTYLNKDCYVLDGIAEKAGWQRAGQNIWTTTWLVQKNRRVDATIEADYMSRRCIGVMLKLQAQNT